MATAEECRRLADKARRKAESAKPGEREELIAVAAEYDKIAEVLETQAQARAVRSG